jgi:predicted secreted Zn-dependent protease
MASSVDLSGVTWRKSTHSSVGNCVEVAHLPNARIALRDSRHHSGPVLTVSQGQWAAFVAGVKEKGGAD